MWLVDLNYNFECDWLIELSDNKLSDNKLSDNILRSELVENRSFFKPIKEICVEVRSLTKFPKWKETKQVIGSLKNHDGNVEDNVD